MAAYAFGSNPPYALLLLLLVWPTRLPSYMLTVKHQSENTHDYVDKRIWCGRTFVRVECQSNDGLLAFGGFHGPEVKARGQVWVNAAAHDHSSRQGRPRRLQFGLLGLHVADLFEGSQPVLGDQHHDDRNFEECCKSVERDRDDRLGIVGRDDVTAVALQHGRLPF